MIISKLDHHHKINTQKLLGRLSCPAAGFMITTGASAESLQQVMEKLVVLLWCSKEDNIASNGLSWCSNKRQHSLNWFVMVQQKKTNQPQMVCHGAAKEAQLASNRGLLHQVATVAGASRRSPQEVQELLELVWAGAIQPLLFGLAGASVRFDTLPKHLGLKALAVAAIGENCAVPTLLLLGDDAGPLSPVLLIWAECHSGQQSMHRWV